MSEQSRREARLQLGHDLADMVRALAASREAQGEADELWGLLMRWAEAAAEEEVALGVPDARSAQQVAERGEQLARALELHSGELSAAQAARARELLSVWRLEQ